MVCFRKKKTFLVDLNLIKKTRKGTIRFSNCKKRIGKYCVALLLDKIQIKV